MSPFTRTIRFACAGLVVFCASSCGGSDGGSSVAGKSGPGTVTAAANVVEVYIDSGPDSANAPTVNTLYTTVTVCVHGSTQCQTIDHIQVDTGSYGLRILAPVLSLNLPLVQATDGNSLGECTQFVDGYSWGPVATADIQISGEAAASVPVQVIGDSNFAAVPAACASKGPAEDTVAAFGANGILGIGVFEADCGANCVDNALNGFYYSCTQSTCTEIAAPASTQVSNPVPFFPTDKNGTIISISGVVAPGAATVTGSLIFGVDTQANNVSGTESVLYVDTAAGDFTTTYNTQVYTQSFLDTGTNGIYFDDSSITLCASSNFANFYCPANTLAVSAMLTGVNNVSATEDFSVGNAESIGMANPSFSVLPTLAGTFSSTGSNPNVTAAETFDWGLPFYYGRRVATVIESFSTVVGTGPYVAF